mmetsp:Transcript_21195/g.46742  ORF Transcript_21195/g.46742 Transcript_21195/m.46742 type:complete len:485 (-) Transcript_21195:118-1572(-)
MEAPDSGVGDATEPDAAAEPPAATDTDIATEPAAPTEEEASPGDAPEPDAAIAETSEATGGEEQRPEADEAGEAGEAGQAGDAELPDDAPVAPAADRTEAEGAADDKTSVGELRREGATEESARANEVEVGTELSVEEAKQRVGPVDPPAAEPPQGAIAEAAPLVAVAGPASPLAPALPVRNAQEEVSGLVIYVIAPAANGGPALSGEELHAVSLAAWKSGAAVVLSAVDASTMASVDDEVSQSTLALMPLVAFTRSRFLLGTPGSEDRRTISNFFSAMALNDSGALDTDEVADGLRRLGFDGDAAAVAEALTPNGAQLTRDGLYNALARATQRPDLLCVCLQDSPREVPSMWPASNFAVVGGKDPVGSAMLSAKVLATKRRAGCKVSSHGVVVLLAARARAGLKPTEYERQMQAELGAVQRSLPLQWPLLWWPAPAELGLLPPGKGPAKKQRPVWEMPKASGPEELQSWLRYLLVVRPAMPAR